MRRGYVTASLLTLLGICILTLHMLFEFPITYVYIQFSFALLFALGGITIFIRLSTRIYQHSPAPPVGVEFKALSADIHFFVLEFAKVFSVCLLVFKFPFEAFILFFILDILDGFILAYRKRSLILRHRIDKFTDILCQIAFYLVAIQLWPSLQVILTVFFLLAVVKTIFFLKTGNRNWLIGLPGFFTTFLFFGLIIDRFYMSLTAFLSDMPAMIAFTIVIVVVSVFYEAIYNGVLYRIRYAKALEVCVA